MLLLWLSLSLQLLTESCRRDSQDGLVLTDYYQKWCPACQKLEPVLSEVSNHLERNGVDIVVEKVDCHECKVVDSSIHSYPTVVLRNNGEEVGRFTGYKTYEEVKKFLVDHSNVPETAFEGHVEIKTGEIKDLTGSDMFQGLDGAWIVLFYYKGHALFDSLLQEVAKIYEGKVKIGRISYKESADFIHRLNIKSYPAMFGFNNGLSAPFLGNLNLHEISKFVDKLTAPVFESITYATLHTKTSLLENGEPLYVVLNKNESLANEYFYNFAHMYRYKVQMYKSSDPRLFERASVYPQADPHTDGHESHKDAVRLVVFKNGSFYEYTGSLAEDDIAAWIFHTHFAYVTEIENSTFSTIFNGFKPSLILISKDEDLLKEYNDFSADRHLGTPYLDLLFSYLDTNKFDLFVPSLLPNLDVPSLVIYDPVSRHFRYKPVALNKDNFKRVAMDTIRLYEGGKLPLYPPSPSYLKYYILAIGFVVCCVLFLTSATKKSKKI